MEENKNMQVWMDRVEESNRQQAKFARIQCLFSAVAAICCAAVLVVVVGLLPKINSMVAQVDVVLTNVEQVSQELADADIEGVMTNLEQVADEMAQADLGGLAENVDGLVKTSETGVQEAVDKLNAIDLDTLNKAIKDLADVVEPLARFFNKF